MKYTSNKPISNFVKSYEEMRELLTSQILVTKNTQNISKSNHIINIPEHLINSFDKAVWQAYINSGFDYDKEKLNESLCKSANANPKIIKTKQRQERIIEMYKKGWKKTTVLAKKLKIRQEVVRETIKQYNLFGEYKTYEKYIYNHTPDPKQIVKKYLKENLNNIGKSSKQIQKNLMSDLNYKIGLKRLRKTFRSIGLKYENWGCICRSKYKPKAPPDQTKEASQRIFSFIERDIEIFWVDEAKFRLSKNGRWYWSNNSQEDESKLVRKEEEDRKVEIIYACNFEGFCGVQIVEGACTTSEFIIFVLRMIESYPQLINGKAVMWVDNATWHHKPNIEKKIGKNFPLKFNCPRSPETNFVENHFALIKNQWHKNNNYKNRDIYHNILKSIYDVDTYNFRQLKKIFFKKIINFLLNKI